MVGNFVFALGATTLLMFIDYPLNVSTRLVKNEKCLYLSEWMAEYPSVDAYVKKVSAERAVVLYDWFVVARWVRKTEAAARVDQAKLACKQIQGIA